MSSMKLSARQQNLIFLAGSGGCFVHGAEVRTARSLERLGLGRLEDNGRGPDSDTGRIGNRERWYFYQLKDKS